MARYKVLVKSFINGQMYEPGTEVEYDGDRIGPNLEYVSGGKPKETYEVDEVSLAPVSSGPPSSPAPKSDGK